MAWCACGITLQVVIPFSVGVGVLNGKFAGFGASKKVLDPLAIYVMYILPKRLHELLPTLW